MVSDPPPAEQSNVPPSRKCGCRCLPDCHCNCPCPDHCNCEKGEMDGSGEAKKCTGKCRDKPSPRNLVVFIDGTSNQFGPNVRISLSYISLSDAIYKNTNVVELRSRILKDSAVPQLTFYSPGIGTYVPERYTSATKWISWSAWKQWVANSWDLAVAWFVLAFSVSTE